MNITNLLETQKSLDIAIAKNLGIEDNFNSVGMVDDRIFALKVELGELSNETGWFKYWKKSHIINQAATLEELADVLHFVLSVGNSRKYTFINEIDPIQWDLVPIGRLFIYIMENAFDSSGKWKNAIEQLFCIGMKLGYSEAEIVQAYQDKNAENYARQSRGY
jgi:dimeric dUTPase (all-alpha-NTP-PPase superfamily)